MAKPTGPRPGVKRNKKPYVRPEESQKQWSEESRAERGFTGRLNVWLLRGLPELLDKLVEHPDFANPAFPEEESDATRSSVISQLILEGYEKRFGKLKRPPATNARREDLAKRKESMFENIRDGNGMYAKK